MRCLIFGKGGISAAIAAEIPKLEVVELSQHEADVTDLPVLKAQVKRYHPDWIVNCAGISDVHDSTLDTILVNLWGSLNVLKAAAGIPTILMGSVAGLYGGPHHPAYSASKAGVISLAQSFAARGERVYCVSPGRVDTPLRDRDWPEEDRRTRLDPREVAFVVEEIIAGHYQPGANVVIRKVGLERIDTFEDLPPWKSPPSRL